MNVITKQLVAVIVLAGALLTASQSFAFGDGSRLFNRLDSDGSGAIEPTEISANREATFDKLDANSDSQISREEIDTKREQIARRIQAEGGQFYERADTNGDGVLSRDEFVNAPKPLIEQADSNGDGNVSKTEFRAHLQALKPSR